jgi:hypothetical protein
MQLNDGPLKIDRLLNLAKAFFSHSLKELLCFGE